VFIYNQRFITKFARGTIWLMKLFCIWLQLLITNLFLPLMGTLLTVFDCERVEDGFVHSYYKNVECYKGIYWLHVIVAGVLWLLMVVLLSLITLLFCNTSFVPLNNISRINAHSDFFLLLYKAALVILLIVAKRMDAIWILWVPMLCFSIILFAKYGTKRIYFFMSPNKVFLYFLILNVWIAIVFTYIAIFDEQATIESYLIGAILFLLIILMKKDANWTTRSGKSRAISDPQEVFTKILIYIELIFKSSKKNNYLLIKGYILNHVKNCSKRDCALKKYTPEDIKKIGCENIINLNTQSYNNNSSLLVHCNELFLEGLNKFPWDNRLRLFYSLYLIQVMKNESSALEQLLIVEQSQPILEDQFLVYHYREIIKSKLICNRNENSNYLNVISIMSYEAHKNLFKEGIEMIANLHNQFWCILIDETPDLTRFRKVGFKIQDSIDTLNTHWNSMQEIDPEQPAILSYYAKFSDEILNDKELSRNLKERISYSNILKININQQHLKAINGCNLQDISPYGDPCICISGQLNKLGMITNFNNSFCNLFGYQRKELIGENISYLMPEIYRSIHEEILKEKAQEKGSSINKKELHIYGKLRSGYVCSMWISLLSLPTVLNESNFISIIRQDKSANNFDVAELILDTAKNVVEITSKAISILKLKPRLIKNKINLADLCPHIEINKEIKRISTATTFHYIEFNDKLNKVTKSGERIDVNLSIEPLKMRNKELIGYSVRIEPVTKTNYETIEQKSPPSFQFWLDRVKHKYIRMYSEEEILEDSPKKGMVHLRSTPGKEEKKSTFALENTDVVSEFLANVTDSTSIYTKDVAQRLKTITARINFVVNHLIDKELFNLLKKDHRDHGKDIVIYRYNKNNDIFENVKNTTAMGLEIDEEYESASRQTRNRFMDKKKTLLASLNIKGKKSVEDILTQTKNTKLSWTIFISYLALLTIFVLAMVDHIYLTKFLNLISNRIRLIDESYLRLMHEQVALLISKELLLVYE